MPSVDQMTPEPLPPAWIRTVERRNCSATSPKHVIGTFFSSLRALAHHDGCFLKRASANEFQGQWFGNDFPLQLKMNVFQPCDRATRERNQNVADDDSSLVRRPVRLDIENDCRALFVTLQ